MNERVLLSICILTYNGSRFLSETVENVVSQIEDADAENAIEVIVCDNASEDRVPEIAREWMLRRPALVRYVRNARNLGFNGNVDRALSESRGKYVHLLGDDDLYCEGGLRTLLNVLRAHDYSLIVLSNLWLNATNAAYLPRAARDGNFPAGKAVEDRDVFLREVLCRCWAVSNVVLKREVACRCHPSQVADWRHLDLAIEVMALESKCFLMPDANPSLMIRQGNQRWLNCDAMGGIYENLGNSIMRARRLGYSRSAVCLALNYFVWAVDATVDVRNPMFWGKNRVQRLFRYWKMLWSCPTFYGKMLKGFLFPKE